MTGGRCGEFDGDARRPTTQYSFVRENPFPQTQFFRANQTDSNDPNDPEIAYRCTSTPQLLRCTGTSPRSSCARTSGAALREAAPLLLNLPHYFVVRTNVKKKRSSRLSSWDSFVRTLVPRQRTP